MTTSNQWSSVEAFEEYRLVRRIGRGGMGDVFLAHDTTLDRLVAVKFMGQLTPASYARERFMIEARAVARVQHPNVMAIYRVGEHDERPYLITEYIRGDSLEALPKPVPWKRALQVGIGLSRGLAAAHRRGVLHRDIKPGNVVVTEDGNVKLLDFGLAKLFDGAAPEEESPPHRDSIVVRLPAATGPSDASDQVNQRAETSPVGLSPRETGPENAKGSSAAAKTAAEKSPSPWDPPGTKPYPTANGHMQSPSTLSSPLTLKGCVVGTPAYVPPELWAGAPASTRSDVHTLGALLYEICTGSAPTAGIPLDSLPQFVQEHDIRPLCTVVPDIDPRFGAVIDRCLLRDPAKRFASADELREALERVALAVEQHPAPEGNPYRRLAAFQSEHHSLFFGRDRDIRAVVDRMRSEHCILVAGDSGVGKSSLCQAGVLPLLREGALGRGRPWTILQVVPGRHPLAALAEAFAQAMGLPQDVLAARLRTEPDELVHELRTHCGDAGVVVFVDQLEDFFTISDPIEGAIASRALGHLAAGIAGIRLLMTMRSDFLARIASLPGLGDELSQALYWLRPMALDEVREAIVGPARAKGVTFESADLVDMLAESTAGGGMPLLQLVLAALWDARDGVSSSITAAALDGIGGVAGAIARHADDVLLGMRHAERAAAQKILTALVALDSTRLRRAEADLVRDDPHARQALHTLVQGRLLIAADASEGTGYELACEALLTCWSTLRCLLDEQADSRIVRHRLQTAIVEWERLGRTCDALWSVRQLQEVSILDPIDLTPREKQFLAASRRTLRRNRVMHHAIIAAMPVAIALAHGGARLDEQESIDDQIAAQTRKADTRGSYPRGPTEEKEPFVRAALPAGVDDSKGLVQISLEGFISSRLDDDGMGLRRCLASPSTHPPACGRSQ